MRGFGHVERLPSVAHRVERGTDVRPHHDTSWSAGVSFASSTAARMSACVTFDRRLEARGRASRHRGRERLQLALHRLGRCHREAEHFTWRSAFDDADRET